MTPPQEVLQLLARTGAASSRQLGRLTALSVNQIHELLGKLESGGLIAPAGRVRLSASGRPQTVWCLTTLGARRGGLYFSPTRGRDGLIKGLLKTQFALTHRDGYYPLFFADQVTLFEEHGAAWPWPGKEGPLRVGILMRIADDTVHIALALSNAREIEQLLENPTYRFRFAEQPGYQLTVLVTEELADFVQACFNPIQDWNDPYFYQQKTYREWRACLRGLAPTEQRYRPHIERVLKWIEKDGAQNSAERHDLVLRAFPKQGFQPEVMKVWIGQMQVAEEAPRDR